MFANKMASMARAARAIPLLTGAARFDESKATVFLKAPIDLPPQRQVALTLERLRTFSLCYSFLGALRRALRREDLRSIPLDEFRLHHHSLRDILEVHLPHLVEEGLVAQNANEISLGNPPNPFLAYLGLLNRLQ